MIARAVSRRAISRVARYYSANAYSSKTEGLSQKTGKGETFFCTCYDDEREALVPGIRRSAPSSRGSRK